MPRFIPSGGADIYDEKIKLLATVAARQIGWIPPEYVRVDLVIWNTNMDRENVMKPLHDPLQGIAFVNDKRILDGNTKRCWDDHGPRVEVSVEAVDRKDYDFRSKKTKPAP